MAIVLGPQDYEDLWQIELDRDMKVCDDNPQDCISGAEMLRHMDELEAKARAAKQ
ncbi:MAG TPA: hypothetical protein VHL59_01380 [Thermoanaerobaculia bacterium]|nr:hypothetical protein [Thermoanaerobaculia bacterium]